MSTESFPQLNGVADPVSAQRQIDDAVAVDRTLQRRRIVGLSVANDAQVMRIGPFRDRRQRPDRERLGAPAVSRLDCMSALGLKVPELTQPPAPSAHS